MSKVHRKYFDATSMLVNYRIAGLYLGISAGIVLVCATAAYWIYQRRDLNILTQINEGK